MALKDQLKKVIKQKKLLQNTKVVEKKIKCVRQKPELVKDCTEKKQGTLQCGEKVLCLHYS